MSSKTERGLFVRALCAASVLISACSSTYRPATFADRPPVTRISDDAPMALPSTRRLNDVARLTDAYLRLPVVGALDVERIPEARDANSLDDVPASSWFRGPAATERIRSSYARRGPPRLPLRLVVGRTVTVRHGVAAVDVRGVRYELSRDSAGLPETLTAAAAIASRLVHALGYRTPEVHVIDLAPAELQSAGPGEAAAAVLSEFIAGGPRDREGRLRVCATRWPVGIDVGIAPAYGERADDPNDRIAHEDRRTLRVLKMVAAWLDLPRLGANHTRDAYVGRPGHGHLLHYLIGLERSLGAGRLRGQRREVPAAGEVHGGFWENLLTLGLIPPDDGAPLRATSLSVLSPVVKLEAYARRYEPAVRLLPQDGYWIAKRMAGVSPELLRWAIAGAKLTDSAVRDHLLEALTARRRQLMIQSYGEVSPLEVVRTDGRRLVLRDEAVVGELVAASAASYVARFVDQRGTRVAPPVRTKATGPETTIALPRPTTSGARYLVVSVRVAHAGRPAPRPFEVHLVRTAGGGRVVGVRH